jgi:DNA-binding winged helix-turn-helix (wHTH) protein
MSSHKQVCATRGEPWTEYAGSPVMRYVFDDYTLDTQRYELRRAEQRVALEPKACDLLRYLVEHRDRVVGRDELIEQVWPDRFISDHSLTARLRAVREALGEDARKPRCIETVHGRGYRFVSPVEVYDREEPDRRESVASGTVSHAEAWLLESPVVEPETPARFETRPMAHHRLTGERKRVTVLSGILANAMTLAERLGLEVLPYLRQRFLALVQQSVEPYGGALQPVGQDGFQALFGVPVAQEDHAHRAVLAALTIQQRLRDTDTDVDAHSDLAFAIRLGVPSGAVMAGSKVDEAQPSATVVGEVTTVAEQLQYRA